MKSLFAGIPDRLFDRLVSRYGQEIMSGLWDRRSLSGPSNRGDEIFIVEQEG
jgi:hypothetical protein